MTIDSQPVGSSVLAAYRPIVFVINTQSATGNQFPPVVYCDIYINGVFYKTLSKTQYFGVDNSNSSSLWRFDIQDACQEVLKSIIEANGIATITLAPASIISVECSFRTSDYDFNGYIASSQTAPIQGTSSTAPVSGGADATSNSFFVVNATLQHTDNQDLFAHLSYYESNTWDENTRPLTHRRNDYRICPADSDSYEIVTDKDVSCIVLRYRYKGDSEYKATYCGATTGSGGGGPTCIAVGWNSPANMPDGQVDEPYSFNIGLSGDAPFTILYIVSMPAGLSAAIVGSNLVISGTPTADGTGLPVELAVGNCTSDQVTISDTIDIIPAVIGVNHKQVCVLHENQVIGQEIWVYARCFGGVNTNVSVSYELFTNYHSYVGTKYILAGNVESTHTKDTYIGDHVDEAYVSLTITDITPATDTDGTILDNGGDCN